MLESIFKPGVVDSVATADVILSENPDKYGSASRVMNPKIEKAANPKESDRIDARCVDALLGIFNKGKALLMK